MRSIFAVLTAFIAVCTSVLAQGTATMRTHSISMPYIDDELQNRWFDFGGNTIINTNQHIRLTSTKQSQLGYLWSRLPLIGDNYEVEVEFKVSGNSGHLYGDGFAMWLTKQRMTEGPVFGSTDRFQGLGIFFDTYDNERAHRHTFPYVMAMLGDGVKPYNNDKDGSDDELAGCEADFRIKGFPTRARFTYHKNNYIQLELMWRREDEWDTCFKKHDVNLPEQVYLGFSAHTGEVTDNHDIISVITKSIPPAPKEAAPQVARSKKKTSSSGVLSALFKLMLAAGFVGILYAGYRYYDQKNRMKRF
ncbi:MAG: legume-like lectin family-domain-containing protein [Benjaminiella poitrasii]|nr:MAG: legume-like lectin family-domain-containing protein [Benjaminiella poitrasii]